jgi:hypothetical protein
MTTGEPAASPSGEDISRRRILKRIGVGAAVAWSAPILTSIKVPAFAQSFGPCREDCPPFDCENPEYCFGGCRCYPPRNGGPCVCGSAGVCGDPGHSDPVCSTDADCVKFGENLVCVDVAPSCACTGDVACIEVGLCEGGNVGGGFKGIAKI